MTTATSRSDIDIATATLRLIATRDAEMARLTDASGTPWADLSLLASVDAVDGPDETMELEGPTVEEAGSRLRWRLGTTRWREKHLVIEVVRDELSMHVEVIGRGRPTDVTLLGGRGALRDGATGSFWSRPYFASVVPGAPGDPRRIVERADGSFDVSAAGGAEAGRGRWFLSPGPLAITASRASVNDPNTVPAGPWLWFGIDAYPSEQNFLGLGYRGADHGFRFVLDFDGQTAVDGWRSPRLRIGEATPDPYAAIRSYASAVRAHDDANDRGHHGGESSATPHWWREPIFSGWGAQCADAVADGRTVADAPGYSSQSRYDRYLGHLAANGLVPGTIVVDDKWQIAYARPEPDPERWPGLRDWIRVRHDAGQRVLLWWKAWDPEGLPAEWCIRTAAGRPVAVDPNHPAAERAVRATIRELLSSDGLDADGLKVDFTARTPTGSSLRREPGPWGIGLLRRLLATVSDEAHSARPDALLVGHVAEPSIAPLLGMIRLNDMRRLDEDGPPVPAVVQMQHRAALVRAACPDLLIDTDDWSPANLADWRAYTARKPDLGVPALYFADRIDATGEALEPEDYELLRTTWARYRADMATRAAAGSQPAAGARMHG